MDYSNMSNEELVRLVGEKDGGAICEQAERFLHGTKGCPPNPQRAYQLFHKGEKRGMKQAYLGLAYMYENGVYVAKNLDIAKEYYELVGPYPPQPPRPPQPSQPPRPPQPDDDVRSRIEKADNARQNGDYFNAKAICNEALKIIDSIDAGKISYSGTEDLERLRINVYWVLAYTAYNEQKSSEMERYLSEEGVYALHPWGAYLAAILHKNSQSPPIVLEQDLQMLFDISQNQNLSMVEKGDVTYMIAELILEGYGSKQGCTLDHAYDYFSQSASYGNPCAKEQLLKFQTNGNGKWIYRK